MGVTVLPWLQVWDETAVSMKVCPTPPQRRRVSAIQQTGWSTKKHNKYFRNTPILKCAATPPPPLAFIPPILSSRLTEEHTPTCSLAPSSSLVYVNTLLIKDTDEPDEPPACTWAYWVHVCVCVAVAFSWSRRRRAAQRPQAPCRRGR